MSKPIFILFACSMTSVFAMDFGKQNASSEDPFIRSFRSVLRAIAKAAASPAGRFAGAATGAARNASRGAAGDPHGHKSSHKGNSHGHGYHQYGHDGGIQRASQEECTQWLSHPKFDMCVVAGGSNPKVDGDTDHYDDKAWHDMFNGLSAHRCSFCGVAGKYFGESEGAVMLTCQHREKKASADGKGIGRVDSRVKKLNSRPILLEPYCVSYGKKLKQDTVLMRFGREAWWAKTTNAGVEYVGEGVTYDEPACFQDGDLNKGVPFRARFQPTPVSVVPGETDFYSDVAASSQVLFAFDDTPDRCTETPKN